MDRREFIKRFFSYSALTAAALTLRPAGKLFAETREGSPDLVAVVGETPGRMFDAGISALGGMTAFVKPGQVVMIKPNISWNSPAERGATTNPELVQRIIEHCLAAGAKRVYVVDNTINSWESCYKTTGMESAVKSAGGVMAPAHSSGYYQKVTIPGAKVLKTTLVHELVLEAEVFINVPILKHHSTTRLTGALKNLMGLVWDRQFYHSAGLSQCIAEFPLLRKPTLNVVDAYTVMMTGGPQGGTYRTTLELRKMQILSTDPVAADAAATRLFNWQPEEIRHLVIASDLRLGSRNLDTLKIKRITL